MENVMTIFPVCCFSGFTLSIFSNCSVTIATFFFADFNCMSFIFCCQYLTTAKDQSSLFGLIFPRCILKSRCCFPTFTAGLMIFLLMLVHGVCPPHMVCTAGNHCRKCFPNVYLHPDPVWSSSRLLLIPSLYFLMYVIKTV